MENKYYTPSIEEFFVRFECEWQSKIRQESWNKQICDVDLINIAYDSFEHSDIEEPFNEQFRVKYLDASDIEGLGFIFEEQVVGKITFKYTKNNFIELHKLYTTILILNNGRTIFEGFIKNKSELIRLLGWLNV